MLMLRAVDNSQADVVNLVHEHQHNSIVTLAIGDGGNDCTMIQSARVGKESNLFCIVVCVKGWCEKTFCTFIQYVRNAWGDTWRMLVECIRRSKDENNS